MATETHYTESGSSPPVDRFFDDSIPFFKFLDLIADDLVSAINERIAFQHCSTREEWLEDLVANEERRKDYACAVKAQLIKRFLQESRLHLAENSPWGRENEALQEAFGFTKEGLQLLEDEYDPHDLGDFFWGCLRSDENAYSLADEYNAKAQEVQS